MIATKTAMAVTVAAAEDGAAVDTQKAEEIVDAALKFVGGTTIEQLHIVADSEALPALAVALATRENLPENLKVEGLFSQLVKWCVLVQILRSE